MLHPEVAERFPTFVRGVVVALRLRHQADGDGIEKLLREAESRVRGNDELAELSAHPRIANWRAAYTAFGAKPSKFPPSIEGLVRRVRRGDSLPYINELVALCNAVSLRHLVPIGGHALDDAEGDLHVKMAAGTEPFTPLGTTEVEYPVPGEVNFTDDSRVLTRRWTWRQAEATRSTPETRNVEINVDGLPPVTREEVRQITQEMADQVKRFFDPASVRCYLLEASSPEIEFEV